jgi:lysophospholipase L1-like esterase
MKKIIFGSILVYLLASCNKTQFSPQNVSHGRANFSNFVSVGNSLTQGYMDGGLYAYGQNNSYPSILAKQMGLSMPVNFSQPMVTGNGSGYIHLVYVNGQLLPVQPTDSSYGTNPAGPDPSWNTWGASLQGQTFNNLGIASLRLTNVVEINSTELLYNQLVCSNLSCGRFMNFGNLAQPVQYLDHIRTSNATFFTNWLGNNDVLLYAGNGGVVLTEDGFQLNPITPPTEFAQKYDSVLLAFSKIGAQGICATIPDVTSIPYFNTVPSYITVNGSPQFLYITTAKGVRQATSQDLILLTAYDSVEAGIGLTASNPLGNDLVLDTSEINAVKSATLQYNASIKSIAASFNYPVVDMYQFLINLQSGIQIDGVTFTRQFIQGGAFGLDGIHPNARGYAIIANQFIAGINSFYGSTLPPVNVNNYKGVIFP